MSLVNIFEQILQKCGKKLRFTGALTAALNEVHAKNVAHGDVHLRNVLFSSSDDIWNTVNVKAKFIDFGNSKILDQALLSRDNAMLMLETTRGDIIKFLSK
jgi:serine/threonine protein kinase